jgi:hypothetical protein
MKLSLEGKWELSFDKNNQEYNQTINLPGTTEEQKLRCPNTEKDQESTLYLGREYKVHGMVWYKKLIQIPNNMEHYEVQLFMERTKFTKVYLDGKYMGDSFETLIPQVYQLGYLTSGEHELVIGVNNALEQYECFPESLYLGHQYTDHTQTNWNGILGEISLSFYKYGYMKEILLVQKENEIRSTIELIFSGEAIKQLPSVLVHMELYELGKNLVWEDNNEYAISPNEKDNILTQHVEGIIPKEVLSQWDEFNPVWYEVRVNLLNANNELLCPTYTTVTSNRDLSICGRNLLLNGKRISLRGSLDCAIYPRTGAAPYQVFEWKIIFQTVMEYGINHYRFHSWCPPKAAFIAADELGFYLQVELSCFANGLYEPTDEKYDKVLADYLYDQGEKIIKTFGNHPSFILFAVGNEMVGNVNAFAALLKQLKSVRDDVLYSQGSNNFLENPTKCVEDDVWIMMRTTKTDNIRASFSHNDLPLGYMQNKTRQGTLTDYNKEASISNVPLISHEIGQYQSFLRIKDKDKFTGPLRPDAWNITEERLKENSLDAMNEDFYKASGALLVSCYKEDIEACLRTGEMSGFQLLGLQDFPGQGTALVGVLDSFMEDKGFITPKNFRQFCDRIVVLGKFPSYTYSLNDKIQLEVEIYNYSGKDLGESLSIKIYKGSKNFLDENEYLSNDLIFEQVTPIVTAIDRQLSSVLTLDIPLDSNELINEIDIEGKGLELTLVLEYGNKLNTYPLWVFKNNLQNEIEENQSSIIDNLSIDGKLTITKQPKDDDNLVITDALNENIIRLVEEGKQALVCSCKIENSIEGFYTSDFWCYPMFKEACIKIGNPVAPGTLGLFIDTTHEALKNFPTKAYSQWQWHQIVMNSSPVILDVMDAKIIVSVIDNFDRNHRLGLIYEMQIGKGKLLVCAANLLELLEIPEAYSLYQSLVNYLKQPN